MHIINLTDHPIKILDNRNRVLRRYPGNKNPARIRIELSHSGFIDGIPIAKIKIKEVKNLPEKKEGIYYIVSNFIKNKLGREDLLIAIEKIRDPRSGREIGCRKLGR